MKKAEYSRMAERESTYWWHLGRLKIINTHLEQAAGKSTKIKILNIGSGTGGTISTLEKYGQVDNIEVSDEAIAFAKQKGFTNVTKIKGIKLPFKDKSYDIVAAFDVLEHIDEEKAALLEWSRVLKDTGAIVLTVPAYQWLWSDHDVSLHHKRRYTVRSLQRAAKDSGLRAEKKSYAIVFSLPLIVGFRFINKLRGTNTDSETSYVNVPRWTNSLFTNILSMEAKAHRYISFPAGTSVVAILKKNYD